MHSWINSIMIFINSIILIIVLFHDKVNFHNIDWFSNSSIIENAYYITGTSTIIAVIITVFSFRTSKKMSEEKTKRDITTSTINACIEYANTIIPEMDNLSDSFKGNILDLDITNWGESDYTRCKKFIDKIDDATFEKAAKILNRVEGFALYFEVGNLISQVAKKVLGKVFCEHVDELSPLIINSIKDKPEDYKELISFYKKMQ